MRRILIIDDETDLLVTLNSLFEKKGLIDYSLVAADYLRFQPKLIKQL